MATKIVVGAGTGDIQAFTGATQLHGYSVHEAAAGVATVVLRDGTTATDPPVAFVELPDNGSETVILPTIDIAAGLFVDRQAGNTRVVLFVS